MIFRFSQLFVDQGTVLFLFLVYTEHYNILYISYWFTNVMKFVLSAMLFLLLVYVTYLHIIYWLVIRYRF
jgi:hypothetical protein